MALKLWSREEWDTEKQWQEHNKQKYAPTHLTRIGYHSIERNGLSLRVDLYGNISTSKVQHSWLHKKPKTREEKKAQHLLGLAQTFPFGAYEFNIFKTNKEGKNDGCMIKITDNIITNHLFFRNNKGTHTANVFYNFNTQPPRIENGIPYQPLLNWMLQEYATECAQPIKEF